MATIDFEAQADRLREAAEKAGEILKSKTPAFEAAVGALPPETRETIESYVKALVGSYDACADYAQARNSVLVDSLEKRAHLDRKYGGMGARG